MKVDYFIGKKDNMRKVIKEYLCLSEEQKKDLWGKATFVFDTNILLDLYRLSKGTRETILTAIKALNDRVYMPYHTAKEFMKNRCEVIIDCIFKYDELEKDNKLFFKKIKANLLLEDNDEDFILLKEYIEKWAEKRKSKNLEITNPQLDRMLDRIMDMFSGKTGEPYTGEQYEALCLEGERRFKKSIPPGYMDNQKESNMYGDFIIWKEILEYSQKNKKDIIYVTRDSKEDWWQISRNRKIGPRVELNREFSDYTAQRFYMYDLQSFIEYSNINGSTNINGSNSEKAISELGKILEENRLSESIKKTEDGIIYNNSILYLNNLHERKRKIQFNLSRLITEREKNAKALDELLAMPENILSEDKKETVSILKESLNSRDNEINFNLQQISELDTKIFNKMHNITKIME